jgi:hypothetical protein
MMAAVEESGKRPWKPYARGFLAVRGEETAADQFCEPDVTG